MFRTAVAIILLGVCAHSNACVCEKISVVQADLIFLGTVKTVTSWQSLQADTGDFYSKMNRISFDVHSISKGPKLRAIVIDSPTNDCGLYPVVGEQYRVFAQYRAEEGFQWYADRCSQTRKVKSVGRKKLNKLNRSGSS